MFLLLRSGATLASIQQCLLKSARYDKCVDGFSSSCLFPLRRSASVYTSADHCSGVYQNKNCFMLQLFSCPSLHCLHKSMTSRFTPGAAPAVAWCSRIACTGAEANQANPPRGQPGRCQASTTRPPSYIPSLIPSRGDLF